MCKTDSIYELFACDRPLNKNNALKHIILYNAFMFAVLLTSLSEHNRDPARLKYVQMHCSENSIVRYLKI